MSPETLAQIANHDTPEAVKVPESSQGLLIWAVGRFGGIVVATLFASYAAHTLWLAHTLQTDRMFSIQEKRIEADLKLSDALSSVREQRVSMDMELVKAMSMLKNSVDEITRQAERAHNHAQNTTRP